MQSISTKQSHKPIAWQQLNDSTGMPEGQGLSQSYPGAEVSVIEPASGSKTTATLGKLESKLSPTSVHGAFTPTSSIERDSTVGFLALPVEIFSKVGLQLWPGDLLALARTCKSLRQILMSKSSMDMWLKVERATPRLPKRFECMSPPQYAALLFTKDCSLCGSGTNVKWEGTLRVRLCESCHEAELVDIYSINDHEKQKLIDYLSLTTKAPKILSKYAWRGPIRRGQATPHCLRRDLRKLHQVRARFVSRGDGQGLRYWNQERRYQVKSGDEFAEEMKGFLVFLQLTPRQKTLLEDGKDLKSVDRLLNYRYYKHYDLDYEYGIDDDEYGEVVRGLDKELLKLKDQVNPFRPVLEALGQKNATTFGDSEDYDETFTPALYCPFPKIETLWELRGYDQVDSGDHCMVTELIRTNPDPFADFIKEWREDGEKQLVEWWLETDTPDASSKAHVSGCTITINGSTNPTDALSQNTRFLLRADTVFSRSEPKSSSNQGSMFLHYPRFYQNERAFSQCQKPAPMVSSRLFRHMQAEKVTKALLANLEMPDAASIELHFVERRFICERCEDGYPMDWDDLLHHYLQELESSNEALADSQKQHTQGSTDAYKTHDVTSSHTSRPFVRKLSEDEMPESDWDEYY